MKNSVILVLIAITVGSIGFSMYAAGKHEDEIEGLKKALEQRNVQPTVVVDEEDEEEFELAISMGHLQRFADKLWFAGQAKNWKLSDFYAHELEEFMEEVVEHEIVEDEKNISDLMERMALPMLGAIEGAIDMQDAAGFQEAYNGLITACNSCHATAGYAFISIQVPTEPCFSNQNFEAKGQ